MNKSGVSLRHWNLIAVASFFILTLAMFWDVLFTEKNTILSLPGTDLSSQFVFWRGFGYYHLRHGHLPLWNPHIYSGMPFFGEFQSALLYPLNFPYLFLPLAKAINAGIALHVFLGGLFMFLWVRRRGLHPFACIVAGVLFMFCAPHFLHIYAGHLPNLCTMIWAPLIFLAIDGFLETHSPLFWLLGVLGVAMQVLAGHPQYLFYTAVAAGLYSLLCIPRLTKRPADLLWILSVWLVAGLLTAVQVLPGIEASGESVRGRGVPYEFASVFSLPPENVLTLLVPRFFGPGISEEGVIYWGRCFVWEMTLYFGVVGLFLAVYGAICAEPSRRRHSITLALTLFLLALGARTPLFRLLYDYVPGFDKFRGNSKFTLQMTLFLLMLAACGLDALMREGTPPAPTGGKSAKGGRFFRPLLAGFITIASGILFVIAGLYVHLSSASGDGLIQWWMTALHNTGEAYFLPYKLLKDEGFIRQAGLIASNGLLVCAGTCLALGILLMTAQSFRKAVWGVGFLAILEICIFARTYRPTFDLSLLEPKPFEKQIADEKGNPRLLNLYNPNSAMFFGLYDIWGDDPGVLRRYAEFIAFTQGADPSNVTQYIKFNRVSPFLSMMRLGYIISTQNKKLQVTRLSNAFPQALFIDKYRVLHTRDAVFAAMSETAFNPRETVILEQEPVPRPIPSKEKGTVQVIDYKTDYLTIEAEVKEPSILLLTETYSKGWSVHPLIMVAQKTYHVLPADWTLRAIPLERGHHKFRLEYRPLSLNTGLLLTLLTFALLLCGLAWHLYRTKPPAHTLPSPVPHEPEEKK